MYIRNSDGRSLDLDLGDIQDLENSTVTLKNKDRGLEKKEVGIPGIGWLTLIDFQIYQSSALGFSSLHKIADELDHNLQINQAWEIFFLYQTPKNKLKMLNMWKIIKLRKLELQQKKVEKQSINNELKQQITKAKKRIQQKIAEVSELKWIIEDKRYQQSTKTIKKMLTLALKQQKQMRPKQKKFIMYYYQIFGEGNKSDDDSIFGESVEENPQPLSELNEPERKADFFPIKGNNDREKKSILLYSKTKKYEQTNGSNISRKTSARIRKSGGSLMKTNLFSKKRSSEQPILDAQKIPVDLLNSNGSKHFLPHIDDSRIKKKKPSDLNQTMPQVLTSRRRGEQKSNQQQVKDVRDDFNDQGVDMLESNISRVGKR